MNRTRSVTGLARDVDLRPLGSEAIRFRIEVLLHSGRVTLRAHEVPVLVDAGPVQTVAGLDGLAGVEREPALAAGLPGTRVPGDGERLQAPIRERDQVLLQGRDPEGIRDFVIVESAVRPVSVNEELSLAREKGRGETSLGELRVIEVAEDRLRIGILHRERVVRALPRLIRLDMACGAYVCAHMRGGRRGNRS
jgi:hypothetical protein